MIGAFLIGATYTYQVGASKTRWLITGALKNG